MVTEPAVAVKLAVEEPPATVTDAGVVSNEVLSEIVTVDPPVGAAADSVTIQLELEPDTTLEGEHARLETVNVIGVTVTAAVAELPFNAAVTVTD